MNDNILYNHNAIEELENLFESGKLCRLVLDEDENDVYIPITETEYFGLIKVYQNGFNEGYDKRSSAIKIMGGNLNSNAGLFSIFSGVYEMAIEYNSISKISDHGFFHVTDNAIFEHGKRVGDYIRCWDMILDNANLFESFFKEKDEDSPSLRRQKFHGTPTKFSELVKSLIANKNLKGKQIEVFRNVCDFFDVDIKDPTPFVSSLKKRNNGSETLF